MPLIYTAPTYGNHYMRLKAEPGQLAVRYDATVDAHHTETPGRLAVWFGRRLVPMLRARIKVLSAR